MTWLNKTWTRKATGIGLLLHFSAWWVLFAWRWAKPWRVPWWPLTSAITPLYEGFRFVWFDQLRPLAIENMVVFLVLISLAALALSTQRRWLVLLAQFTIALYWLSAAVLIGATTG